MAMTTLQIELKKLIAKDPRFAERVAVKMNVAAKTIVRWTTPEKKEFSIADEEKLKQVLEELANGK